MPSAAPPRSESSRPEGCTHHKLRRLTRRVTQLYDAELAQAGLKATQYSLLSHVMNLGPVRPGELARAMTLDASTLTRNLRPLLDAGWVELGAGGDARSRSVSLTDAGRAKRAEGQRRWRVAQQGIVALLGAPQVAALHALLDESLQSLQVQAKVQVKAETDE